MRASRRGHERAHGAARLSCSASGPFCGRSDIRRWLDAGAVGERALQIHEAKRRDCARRLVVSERRSAVDVAHRAALERRSRGFGRYLIAMSVGIATTLAWQSYSGAAKRVFASNVPDLAGRRRPGKLSRAGSTSLAGGSLCRSRHIISDQRTRMPTAGRLPGRERGRFV
jgi:hypothetical protein